MQSSDTEADATHKNATYLYIQKSETDKTTAKRCPVMTLLISSYGGRWDAESAALRFTSLAHLKKLHLYSWLTS